MLLWAREQEREYGYDDSGISNYPNRLSERWACWETMKRALHWQRSRKSELDEAHRCHAPPRTRTGGRGGTGRRMGCQLFHVDSGEDAKGSHLESKAFLSCGNWGWLFAQSWLQVYLSYFTTAWILSLDNNYIRNIFSHTMARDQITRHGTQPDYFFCMSLNRSDIRYNLYCQCWLCNIPSSVESEGSQNRKNR